jgi:hypothetical protein
MQKIILFIAPALLLVSCSTYQYATINSSSVKKNEKQEFVIDNDSFQLVYNFNGANAPVNITIHNKLNIPMYIDWQRSAIIVNDKANSYVPEKVNIEGGFSGGTSTYTIPAYRNKNYAYNSGYSSTSGSLSATAVVPEQIAFLPPQTYVTKTPVGVTSEFMQVPDTNWHKIQYKMVDGSNLQLKKATFTESTTPLKFRSYLTIMVGESAGKPVVYEHSFYISELLASDQGPSNVWLASVYRGNQFFVSSSGSTGAYNAPPSGKPNVTTGTH